MRKAERLFQIVNLLRGRRTVMTAAQIADALGVTERTIYRDMQALMLSNVPIESEAGVGYRLKHRIDIPPIMFDASELEALILGVRMVQGWAGDALGECATRALDKINAVLPDSLYHDVSQKPDSIVVADHHRKIVTRYSNELHEAIQCKRKLVIEYRKPDCDPEPRQVCPLGMVYWGAVWTLIAWCELRDSYRMFRLDRIENLIPLDERFETAPDRNLQHYIESCRD